MQQQQRKTLAEQIWLAHYNRVLRDRGIITDTAYRKMVAKIAARSTAPQR